MTDLGRGGLPFSATRREGQVMKGQPILHFESSDSRMLRCEAQAGDSVRALPRIIDRRAWRYCRKAL